MKLTPLLTSLLIILAKLLDGPNFWLLLTILTIFEVEDQTWPLQDSFANFNIFWRALLITDINPSFKFSQSRLKGISRELSFDDDKDTLSVSSRSGPGASKSRSTTYISGAGSQNSSNNVKHQDAKKSVPPSPAIKKKVFFWNDIKSVSIHAV